MKTCTECKEDKILDEFRCTFDSRRGKSYHRKGCLDCERKATRKRARVRRLTPASKKKRQVERQEIAEKAGRVFKTWGERAIERRLAQMVRLLAQAKRKYEWVWNKDQRLREYREKEKARYRAKYNDSAFRTKERARQQRYRHTNPDKVAEWMDKRRRLVAQVNDGTVGDSYTELMNEYKSCPYCSVELTSSNKSLDHMEPISKGGIHSSSNIIVCCLTCNCKKQSKDFTTWIDSLPAFNRNVSVRAWEVKKSATVGQMGLCLNF